jgi:hypothetical protein
MTRRRLAQWVGGVLAVVALLALVTVAPIGPVAKATKDASATAVGVAHPLGLEAEQDCFDVDYSVEVTYSEIYPLLDVWGFKRVIDVSLDQGTLTVAGRDDCADLADGVGATAYVYSPVCESGMCEDAYLEYLNDGEPGSTSFTMMYVGPQALPGSGVIRGHWCLGFAAQVSYANPNGASVGDSARVTDTDFCLDVA